MDGYQAGAASVFATAAREDKPDFCLSVLEESADGMTYEVIGVKRGEKGYYRTSYERQTREWMRMMNERMGVDQAMAEAMAFCSVFNCWDRYEGVERSLREMLEEK
jgi:hypothetical protein